MRVPIKSRGRVRTDRIGSIGLICCLVAGTEVTTGRYVPPQLSKSEVQHTGSVVDFGFKE
jgi:hypothetical protein